jgi:chromosome segregation ATPase
METLQDALNKTIGGRGVIDQDEFAKQMEASRPAASAPVDRRNPASLQRELVNLQGNFEATEIDRERAERELNNLTGAHAKITKQLASLKKHENEPQLQSAITTLKNKLAEIDDALNNPRIGVKAILETKTKIAASRKAQIEDFLASRPFDGAPTNREVLEKDREIQNILDEVARMDTNIDGLQETAGRSSTRPIPSQHAG